MIKPETKKIVTAFFAGAGLLFTFASVLLMNPEDMFRWAMYIHETNSEKVDKAISKNINGENLEKCENETLNLSAEINNKELIIIQLKEENTQLSKLISDVKTQEKTNASKLIKNKTKITNVKPSKPEEDIKVKFKIFKNRIPYIFHNGKVSIKVWADPRNQFQHLGNKKCSITYKSHYNENESDKFTLNQGENKKIYINDQSYVIYFVEYNYEYCALDIYKI